MIKQTIIVRADLKMNKGKIAAQVGHACVNGSNYVRENNPLWYQNWWPSQTKVVLKVNDLEILNEIRDRVEKENLPYALIIDEGRTQIEPNTITCLSIGPAPEDLIDNITNDLKLL